MSIRGTRPYETDYDQRIAALVEEILSLENEINDSIEGETRIALQTVMAQYGKKLLAIARAYADIVK